MDNKEFYSIGEVSKICNLSKKTLRYYDEMGVLCPDKVSDENNYRYYSRRTMLSVPMIRYYKQTGFKLEEMKEFLEGTGATYVVFEKHFRDKINELRDLQSELDLKLTSIRDWYDLILEAQMVLQNNVHEVSIKYIEASHLCYLDQDFEYDYMDSIINIEFTNYISSINNAITGPVIINYPNFKDKMSKECSKMRILQKTILKCNEHEIIDFGGCMAMSCYHIGPHETINNTYKKMCDWAVANGYKCAQDSYERYVTDYWTTRNTEKFVTEILIKVTRE